jgi:hypothetical protein
MNGLAMLQTLLVDSSPEHSCDGPARTTRPLSRKVIEKPHATIPSDKERLANQLLTLKG